MEGGGFIALFCFVERWMMAIIQFSERIEKALNADIRQVHGEKQINVVLDKIKPLQKYSPDYPTEKVEKLIFKILRKYPVQLQGIQVLTLPNEIDWFKVDIVRTDNREWIRTLYGISTRELMLKVCIFLYVFAKHFDEYKIEEREGNDK